MGIHMLHPAHPLRSRRAWLALVFGVIAVGVGIGMMLDAGLGVSPLDAFFAGMAAKTGYTVGTVLIVASAVFVLVSWLLGLKPGVGTVISFVSIGLAIDATSHVSSALDVHAWPIAGRSAWWLTGLLVFSTGVVALIASDLGASPYDQIVRSTAERLHISLGWSRLVFDGVCLAAAFLLGGAWGIGTLILLLAVPLILSKGISPARKLIHPQRYGLTGSTNTHPLPDPVG